jgi:membrane protein implicated in regulation of membrane protease activity
MLVLGVVLIAAAIALGAGAVFDGSEAASVEVFGTNVDTTVAGVFFGGAATMLLFMVGVLMLVSSMGRARRKRVARKETKRRQRDSVSQLEQERAELRAENERLAGQLGSSREPDAADDTAEGTTAAGGATRRGDTTTDRDGDGRTESRDPRPMRESDGPAATGGTHSRDTTDGAENDARSVDVRERTAVHKDTSTT